LPTVRDANETKHPHACQPGVPPIICPDVRFVDRQIAGCIP
jgi:hypothetical protein